MTASSPRRSLPIDADRPIRQLAHGHAAFCLGGSYEAPALQPQAAISAADVSDDFGFAPLPAGPSAAGSPRSPAGWSMQCSARRPVRNWRCASSSVLSRRHALMDMSIATGQLPARRSAIAAVASRSSFLGDTAALLERATVRPSTPSYPRVSAQLQAMLESVLVGRLEAGRRSSADGGDDRRDHRTAGRRDGRRRLTRGRERDLFVIGR